GPMKPVAFVTGEPPMKSLRPLKAVAVVAAVLLLSSAARADDGISQTAVESAKKFFDSTERGKEVLNSVHWLGGYNSHKYAEYVTVNDGYGKTIPGHFAVVYDFKWWDNTGDTRIAFLCNDKGTFYKLQVMSTNAEFS